MKTLTAAIALLALTICTAHAGEDYTSAIDGKCLTGYHEFLSYCFPNKTVVTEAPPPAQNYEDPNTWSKAMKPGDLEKLDRFICQQHHYPWQC